MTESRTYQLGVNGFAQWTIENAARRRSSPAAAGTCCRRDVTSPRFHASPPLTNHVRATRLPRTRLRMVSCSKVEMLERWRMWLWHFQANRRWGTRNWETVLKNPVRFVKWRAGSIACVKVLLSDFTNSSSSSLWSSCVADADIIFLSCFFFMAALCNRGAIIFLPCSFFLSIFFFISSPNLSGRRLDVYHTLTHGVALCEFRMQVWNVQFVTRCKYGTQKSRQKSPSGHHRTSLSGYISFFFFPRLVLLAVANWMSIPYFYTWCSPSANRMQVWNLLHAARWKYRTQKIAKNRHLGTMIPSHNFVGLYVRN